MEKLPIEFKTKWMAALRSGAYEQGQYRLHEDGKYCCLGVACHVAGLPLDKLKDGQWIEKGFGLPEAITGNGHNPNADHLTSMNDGGVDGEQKSFAVIADWIEENL